MATTQQCPHCGAENRSGAAFCGSCGRRLVDEQPGAVVPIAPPTVRSTQTRQPLTFIISIVVLVTIATVGALRLFPREQPAAVPPPVPAPAERGALTLRTIPLVGVVDSGRVLNESARALAYQRQLDEREKAAAGELEILAQSASSQEVDRRRQQLLAELDNLRTRLKRQLDADLAQAVATVANRRGPMIAVISKKGTLYLREPNAVDITDDVIGELR